MLARIQISDEELTRFAGELDSLLAAVAEVREVASDDVPPMSHPIAMTNVFRPDEPQPGLSIDQVLSGAPESEGTRFVVPRILGED